MRLTLPWYNAPLRSKTTWRVIPLAVNAVSAATFANAHGSLDIGAEGIPIRERDLFKVDAGSDGHARF